MKPSWTHLGLGAGAAYLGARHFSRSRGRKALLEPLPIESEPDTIISPEGFRVPRSLGRLAKDKKTRTVSPKKYVPADVPGIDAAGVTVLTAGSRYVRLNDDLRDFNPRVWAKVQQNIARIEAMGPRRWQRVLEAVDSKQTLPVVKRALYAWLTTQRFRLAGIRPGMSPAELYGVVTMGVAGKRTTSGLPWWAAASDKSAKVLYPWMRKHRGREPQMPTVLPTNYVLALLSVSAKVMKGVKKGFWTGVMYLAPSTEAGYNVCEGQSKGCATACLGHSTGQLTGEIQQTRRIRRTLHHLLFPRSFAGQILQEIGMFRAHAFAVGLKPAIRLNGSSDIAWERRENGAIPQQFPDTQFYDYTKLPFAERAGAFRLRLPNGRYQYHLTFSWSERKDARKNSIEYLQAGGNVAVVVGAQGVHVSDSYHYTPDDGGFDTKGRLVFKPYLPQNPNPKARQQNAARAFLRYANTEGVLGFGAINGDETDVRFEDPPGKWVVLYAKGAYAAQDRSNFVVRVDPSGRPVNLGEENLIDFYRRGAASRYRGRRDARTMMNWYEESLDHIC